MIETVITIILAPVALAAIILFVCLAIGIIKAFKKNKSTTIYAGDEDRVEFFKEIISTLGLKIKYEIKIVDGEYEIIIN